MERIAEQAYKVLSHRPNWITKKRNKAFCLSQPSTKVDLGDRQPTQPQPLL